MARPKQIKEVVVPSIDEIRFHTHHGTVLQIKHGSILSPHVWVEAHPDEPNKKMFTHIAKNDIVEGIDAVNEHLSKINSK